MEIDNNIFLAKVIEHFGYDWFSQQWEEFRIKRNNYEKNSLNKEVVLLELGLHPLVKEIIKYQDLSSSDIDYSKIPNKSLGHIDIQYLGRDLELMDKEIKERGGRLIKDLKQPSGYDNHRFNLLVATGYKQLGYDVQFVPSSSKNGKTPDLHISKNGNSFYIECKQRDQFASDKNRFGLVAQISEELFQFLRSFNFLYLGIRIDILKGNSVVDVQQITKTIKEQLIRRDLSPIDLKQDGVTISFFDIKNNSKILKLLKDTGHMDGQIVFTSAEDFYFSSDPNTHNSFFVNKNIGETLPLNIYSLLEDANSKNTSEESLVVYLDLGRGFPEWGDKLVDEVISQWNNNLDDYPNIAGLVVIQTLPRIMQSSEIIIHPCPRFVGRLSKLGITATNTIEFFGNQGTTGIDGYLRL